MKVRHLPAEYAFAWQHLAIDLDETPRGNKWIFVITDHFTIWSDAFPLPDAPAQTAARILEERA
jgi:hypothetical protein